MDKKKLIILSVCIFCAAVFAVCCVVFFTSNRPLDMQLRDKYPLISESSYTMDDPAFGFEQRVLLAPNIVQIKVLKKLPEYSVSIEDNAVGISGEVVFCQYQVALVSNIAGTRISTGTDNTFIITFAKNFSGSYPALTDGMEAICSIEAASGVHSGKYILFDRTFYYVDGNAALSAYEGDDSPAKTICYKDELIRKIKSIRNA